MEIHKITFDGIEYEVKEPTLESWGRLTLTKDIMDTEEFALQLISTQTGLNRAQLLKCDWYDIHSVANGIMSYFNTIEDKYYNTFTFEGVEYKFVDLEKISFGEFVDIDTYLQKSETEKVNRLAYYMALLYRPIGETEYDIEKQREREEIFKKLPVKYFFGSNKVFFCLEKMLLRNTKASFYRLKMKYYWRRMMMYLLVVFTGGIVLSVVWLMRTLQKSRRLLKSPLIWLSTTWDTLNHSLMKKINNLKKRWLKDDNNG